MRRRITWPSVDGVKPRLAARIAFSTACTIERSQTCTLIMRGSGTLTVASWLSGMLCAVGFDLDRVEQMRRGAAGAQAAEFLLSTPSAPCMRRLSSLMS